jgi:polyisoprenoid-binding protein YceI
MKTLNSIRIHLCIVLLLVLPSSAVWAQWELDSTKSAINFVSVKNDSVGETHSFKSLAGFIGEAGNVQLAIDLDSVDTLIEIRNERLRELLFETVKFPAAKIEATVELAILKTAAAGGVLTLEVPVSLTLHGEKKTLLVPLIVVGEGDQRLRVVSARPVLINASEFALVEGISALREIAGLKAISNVVPVTFNLLFVPAD